MSRSSVFRAVAHCFRTLSLVVFDLVRLAFLAAHSRSALAAENLFLRKQLALFQERKARFTKLLRSQLRNSGGVVSPLMHLDRQPGSLWP